MAPGSGDTAIEDRLFVAGTSHRTAPVAFREKLAPRPDQIPAILRDLVSGRVDEAVLVTTCNRFEIYGVARESADVALVAPALATHFGVDVDANRSAFYMHLGVAAALHAFRVAASLDSLVVGESQVLGQVKNAHRRATEAGTCGKVLNRLFNKAIASGKRVRTETKIGANAVSVSYAAVELAKKLFGRLDGRRVLVVGVGEMSTLVAQHLKSNGATDLTITNRTLQGAVNMADEVGGQVIEFERFEEALAGVDIVLTATGSTRPILTAEQVGRVLASRRQKPLFLKIGRAHV
jgi:glutamyl-tRNA reductase